jgi:acyl carrier protein
MRDPAAPHFESDKNKADIKMNNIKERVANCFLNVFPNIRPDEISGASTTSLAGWDSVAHVTLLSSISEEFGLDFELEDFEELVSSQLIVEYLEKKIPDA